MSSVANTGGPPASVTQSAVPAGQTLKQTKLVKVMMKQQ